MKRRHFLGAGAASLALVGTGSVAAFGGSRGGRGLVASAYVDVADVDPAALASALRGATGADALDGARALPASRVRHDGSARAPLEVRALGVFGALPRTVRSAALEVAYRQDFSRVQALVRFVRRGGVDHVSAPTRCRVPVSHTDGLRLRWRREHAIAGEQTQALALGDARHAPRSGLYVLALLDDGRAPDWNRLTLAPTLEARGPLVRENGEPAPFPYVLLGLGSAETGGAPAV